jgi:tetratricopeptide (TPR) repeat protein
MELLKYISILLAISSCSTSNVEVDEAVDTGEAKVEASGEAKAKKSATDVEKILVALNPVEPQAVFNWQGYFKTPPTSKDRSQIESLVKTLESAKSEDDLLKRARNETALGRYASAEASYREVLRKNRNNMEAMIEMAGLYHKIRNQKLAMQVLTDVKDMLAGLEQPDKKLIFRYRYIQAVVLIQNGDRESGHSILSELIGQEKTFVPGYAALASSYLSTGKYQIAKFIVERALDRGAEDPSLYNLLGVTYERQRSFIQAREYYNKAIAQNDAFAPALVNRANIYLKTKEYRLAETDLKKAIEVDPLNVDAMISLAVVLRQTGRSSLAKNHLSRVLDIVPDSAEARFNLAIVMRDNEKNSSEAIRLFSEVAQTDKASSELKMMAKSAMDAIKNF